MGPDYRSLALDELAVVDASDVQTTSLPQGAPRDPAWWVRQIFSIESTPPWVKALFALRQALVPLVGIDRGSRDAFDVDRVEGDEALVVTRERHLDFVFGVRVDQDARLVVATTAVQLHGWRGRLYWVPVSRLHGPVLRSMLARASATAATAGPTPS